MPSRHRLRGRRLVGACILMLVVVACSDDPATPSGDGDASTNSSNGTSSGGASTTSSQGATGGSAGDTSSGNSTTGGASPARGGATAEGGNASVEGDSGETSGRESEASRGSSVGGSSTPSASVPMATEDGTSPYEVECSGPSNPCAAVDPGLPCLGVGVSESSAGYACSNRCETIADCNDAPSSTDAVVDCVQLTENKHCLLVCELRDEQFDCPSGMSCYVFEGSFIGYCLYL